MSEVKIPTNADEAASMALIGMSWLEQNAPERLTELHREIRAEAGRAGFVAGCHCGANYNIHDWDNQADEYANSIRREK